MSQLNGDSKLFKLTKKHDINDKEPILLLKERASPPSPSLLNSASRNMNYDHRKYSNIGAVKYSNNHHEDRHNNLEPLGAASFSRHESMGMADDVMDSFEARMLQEMKAEMDAEKQSTNSKSGSTEGRKGATSTSGVGSEPGSTATAISRKKTAKAVDEKAVVSNGDNHDESVSPDMGRRGSSGLQSPWSDEHDQQTTSEKYNFDAVTSSIEDTSTSYSKKAVRPAVRNITCLGLILVFLNFRSERRKLMMSITTRTR